MKLYDAVMDRWQITMSMYAAMCSYWPKNDFLVVWAGECEYRTEIKEAFCCKVLRTSNP
jgi:hypothetical protein